MYYGTDTRAVELLAGALLRRPAWPAGPDLLARIPSQVLTAAGVVVLAVTAYWWSTVEQTSSWLYEGGLTVYALTTVVLLAVILQPGAGPAGAWPSSRSASSAGSPTASTSCTGRSSCG